LGDETVTGEECSITHVYCVYINATPEAVWDAIVNPELNGSYGYRVRCAYDLRPDGAFMGFPSDEMRLLGVPKAVADGVVIDVEPPRRFVHTWRMLFTPELASEGFTKVTWEIDGGRFGVTRLRVTHECETAATVAGLTSGALEDEGGGGGWNWVLCGLKTFVETGDTLGVDRSSLD
jgi:uncharacterized protein YndB with AHSA1/START domain